ncbi:histone deacetylase family protein [Thalassotalea sp. 1_MG-2023]|uniref:histone deacetylase family protein n=1 Tax=Thalassotalea sp. 1_MG-2023 TaxID=3062680 RepID=UPI0026E40DD5|nr:histone deacetylase family protein [Thalassotalea sp. 1_MG-2023]MDO6428825.1 histone deacetylase family protein [Thalassotalea sp. 1_MG-2023]
MTVGIIGHHRCNGHMMGEYHPESPARIDAIQDQLIRSGLEYVIKQFDATPIDKSLLLLAHDKHYVDYIYNNAPSEGLFRLDDDTAMNANTLTAARYSAGAIKDAVDLVMNETLSSAFCLTRPPGHHAERDKAMGFCIFNNIAIAAEYVKKQYGIKRVAILDIDVHHGNGTENIIKDKSGILFCSSYQYPFYPFKMQESNTPPIINTPLPPTTKGPEFRQAIKDKWLVHLHTFKPEFIFISAGFDAHIEDEMSQISLTEDDYRWVTEEIKTIADTYAKGRMVSALEGGYALSALGRCAVAHINGLIGN